MKQIKIFTSEDEFVQSIGSYHFPIAIQMTVVKDLNTLFASQGIKLIAKVVKDIASAKDNRQKG